MRATATEKKVISMLKENTGQHFLDSGGAYGRNWERNQVRDFRHEPSCKVDIDKYGDQVCINVTYNLFHYLTTFLEYDRKAAALDRSFHKFAERPEYERENWLGIYDPWLKHMGFREIDGDNSYNRETILSQVIQYTIFEDQDNNHFILLQVHGGCDVRGGYTKPVVFRMLDFEYFYMAMTDVSARCDGYSPGQKAGDSGLFDLEAIRCENYWTSDDAGYHMYLHGCYDGGKHFEKFTEYDEEAGKLKCLDCGGHIDFFVMDSF